MISRHWGDMSRAFPELIRELERLPPAAGRLPPATVLDGELVMLDQRFDELLGRSAVSRSQTVARAARERPATIVAWDALVHAGLDVRHLPLVERKVMLKRALQGLERVCYATHVAGHGEAMYAQAVAEELEGIVAKRADSPYRAGRTPDWLKSRRRLVGSGRRDGWSTGGRRSQIGEAAISPSRLPDLLGVVGGDSHPFLFLAAEMAYGAARCRAKDTVMSDEVTSDAADRRTLQTSCIGNACAQREQ
jgi:ATP-dependent DNA ligase